MAEKKKLADKVDKRRRSKITIPGLDKPIYLTYKTKAELETKKKQLMERYVGGEFVADKPFVQMVKEWFEVVKKPSIKTTATLQAWRQTVNLHVIPHIDDRILCRAIHYRDLQTCLNHTKGMSDAVITRTKSVLTQVCRYAYLENIIDRDPSVGLVSPPHAKAKKKNALSDEQINRIFAAADNDEYGLMIYLLYYLGCRRGEMLGLKWGDIDLKEGMVHIQRDFDFITGEIGDLKTDAADRYVPIPDELMEILKPVRGLPGTYVINQNGTHATIGLFMYHFSKIIVEAGYGTVKPSSVGKKTLYPWSDYNLQITSHWFRHNYITACVLAGVPAEVTMKIVGHTDYKTTINVYTHIDEEKKRKSAYELSGILKKSHYSAVANWLPKSSS